MSLLDRLFGKDSARAIEHEVKDAKRAIERNVKQAKRDILADLSDDLTDALAGLTPLAQSALLAEVRTQIPKAIRKARETAEKVQ